MREKLSKQERERLDVTDLKEEKLDGLEDRRNSSNRLWEIGSTEEGVRTFFLRTVVVS